MTQKTLVKKLIEVFEEGLEATKSSKNAMEVMELLRTRHLRAGVCYLADKAFRQDVYEAPWIKKHSSDDDYWCLTPINCSTKRQIRDTLRKRLKILKSL